MYIILKTVQTLLHEGARFNSSGDLKKYDSNGKEIIGIRSEYLRYLGTIMRVRKDMFEGDKVETYTALDIQDRFGFYKAEIQEILNHDFILNGFYYFYNYPCNIKVKYKVLGIGEKSLFLKNTITGEELSKPNKWCEKYLKEE